MNVARVSHAAAHNDPCRIRVGHAGYISPQLRQRLLRVAEVIHLRAHAIHEGDMQAAELAVGIVAEVEQAAALDRAAAVSGDEERKLCGIVRIPIPEAGSKHDHAVLKKAAL